MNSLAVIPAKAGIQPDSLPHTSADWIPAVAGMTPLYCATEQR